MAVIGSMPAHAVHLIGIEHHPLAGGRGEIPGVHEQVAEDEHRDRTVERVHTRLRMAELDVRSARVVDERLQCRIERGPCRRWGVGDRRQRAEIAAGAGLQERRHPLDQVTHDVTRHPAHARGRALPPVEGHGGGDRGEAGGNSAVAPGDAALLGEQHLQPVEGVLHAGLHAGFEVAIAVLAAGVLRQRGERGDAIGFGERGGVQRGRIGEAFEHLAAHHAARRIELRVLTVPAELAAVLVAHHVTPPATHS